MDVSPAWVLQPGADVRDARSAARARRRRLDISPDHASGRHGYVVQRFHDREPTPAHNGFFSGGWALFAYKINSQSVMFFGYGDYRTLDEQGGFRSSTGRFSS